MPAVARGAGWGYFRVGRFRGAPVRIHWTTPIGAFLFSGMIFGAAFAPAAWAAFVVLVLVHEIGHAVIVRRCGLAVLSIDVHGAGGVCRWSGHASDVNRAKIAWGGVVAQTLLLVATTLVAPVAPSHPLVGQVVQTWTATNLLMIALNLLPVRGLDGAEAWTLFRWRNVRALGKRASLEAKRRRVEHELKALEAELRGPGGGRGRKTDDDSMIN
jgi:stage IV sporulation protein FB